MNIKTEPVAVAGVLSVAIKATVTLLVAFGVHITDVQMVAVDTFVGAVITLGAVLFARARVTPTAKLDQLPPPPPPVR